jgi:quercetin dioxygenase-like cupin family protein
MKLKTEEGITINFYKTKMVFKTMLIETNNSYSTILMTHQPLVGPALHIHPYGPETFFIINGDYTFTLDGEIIEATKGDFIIIPTNAPHKYKSGKLGGQMLVTTPPNVEKYFLHIADELLKGEVSLEYEFEFAQKNGQVFLDKSEHWGHK